MSFSQLQLMKNISFVLYIQVKINPIMTREYAKKSKKRAQKNKKNFLLNIFLCSSWRSFSFWRKGKNYYSNVVVEHSQKLSQSFFFLLFFSIRALKKLLFCWTIFTSHFSTFFHENFAKFFQSIFHVRENVLKFFHEKKLLHCL
jgi:hypothetical protein